jgi:hypothetical protein
VHRRISAANSTFKYDLGSENHEGAQDSTISVFTDPGPQVRRRGTRVSITARRSTPPPASQQAHRTVKQCYKSSRAWISRRSSKRSRRRPGIMANKIVNSTVDGTFRQTNLTNESTEYLAKREELRLAEIDLIVDVIDFHEGSESAYSSRNRSFIQTANESHATSGKPLPAGSSQVCT